MICRRLVLSLLLTFIGLPATQAADIVIGTASKSGVYFQVGRALCRLMERSSKGLSCEALETAGSVFNLQNVQVGALELGLVQSDIQFHGVNRSGPFRFVDAPHDNVRALFSLYTEPFTLVARRDSGIRNLDDLKGRRVNIGNPGSGQRATMEVVMDAKGWSKDDFQLATELPASQQSLALCHNRVQAMVYTVGHPNPSVAKAVKLCRSVIAEVSGPDIERLVSDTPYYTLAHIPGGLYAGVDEPVRTFGVLATVVSSVDVDEELVYLVVKTLFENIERFRAMHRVFQPLEPRRMIKDGLSAPLHKGAERYYREKGWM